jgi:hypothetical protein
MTGRLYYDPGKPSEFWTLGKHKAVAKESNIGKRPNEIKAWLVKTTHPLFIARSGKVFPGIHIASIIWWMFGGCDLVDVQVLSKFNHN